MIRKIRQYIDAHRLLEAGSTVVVGFSGGADSMALLSALQRLGYDCRAAHCNFHLRGEESLRDEDAACRWAQSQGIPFLKQDFDTRGVARRRGISIEMAARELRYEWFEEVRQGCTAEAVAVAHHGDDNIETLLLNLLRGGGIRGLAGMQPKNGYVVRPLLGISREEILRYAAEQALPFVTDSSNLLEEHTRNKIRLTVLPALRTVQPSVRSALIHSQENLNEAARIYEFHIQTAIEQVFDGEKGTIDIPRLQALPSPEAVLFELLKNYGFGRDTIREAAKAMVKQSGKEFYSQKYLLLKDRDCFLLLPREAEKGADFWEIHEEDVEWITVDASFEITKDRNTACFDAERLRFPLQIRPWRQGDKFMPFGMNQFQKLSDYFCAHKFTKPEKEKVRLLCSGEDVLWIVGHRTDHRYRITQATKKAVVVKLFLEKHWH
jgi:tRNA(Ile)-lysidine synthase